MANTFHRWNKNSLLLEVHVQAKASRDAIMGEHNNRLKISIIAAPDSGKANAHLIKFLAKHFGVPQKNVEILRGHKAKYKSVVVVEPRNNLYPPGLPPIS